MLSYDTCRLPFRPFVGQSGIDRERMKQRPAALESAVRARLAAPVFRLRPFATPRPGERVGRDERKRRPARSGSRSVARHPTGTAVRHSRSRAPTARDRGRCKRALGREVAGLGKDTHIELLLAGALIGREAMVELMQHLCFVQRQVLVVGADEYIAL